MDKQEWFDLVEQAEKVNNALLNGDPEEIVSDTLNLINLIHYRADDAAECGGWFSELEEYIDSLQ